MMAKELTGDRALLEDDSAEPPEREAALQRLLSDGHVDVADVIKRWLDGAEPLLRNVALKALLRMQHREYVDLALDWLQPGAFPGPKEDEYIDEDAFAKMAAASGLSVYMYGLWKERRRICQGLAKTLVESSDPGVQRACYEALFAADGELFPGVPLKDFSPERDIDWSLVRRYLPDAGDSSR